MNNDMYICQPDTKRVCEEHEIYESRLPLDNAHLLELGCGKADKTRAIALTGRVASITALEVDEIQHVKNLQITDLPLVQFARGGAEKIPFPDERFDIVLLFKSLHHVPVEQMDQALAEIHRVLKPGGLAYISEPVYAGAFNDILSLFNDEQQVRKAAFAAVQRAVSSGLMALVRQEFFNNPTCYESFDQFDERVLQVTHTSHQLSPERYLQVKEKFMAHMTDGGAHFQIPIRVDLLRKSVA